MLQARINILVNMPIKEIADRVSGVVRVGDAVRWHFVRSCDAIVNPLIVLLVIGPCVRLVKIDIKHK